MQCFYLRDSLEDRIRLITDEAQTNKGRAITLTLTRWNNLLRRAKKPFSMKEKPIDLISVSVKDQKTQKPIFKAPLYIRLVVFW